MGNDRIRFAIIGAQKASTTFLARVVREHPDAYMPEQEFRTFEDPEYGPVHERALEALRRAGRGRMLGIKRPDYLALPEVALRLRDHNPEMKLVVVTRPRIPRLVSAYFFYMKFGFVPLLPLEEGVRRALDDPEYLRRHPRAAELVEFGRYGKHLAHYLELFPARNLFVLSQAEVTAAPQEARARLYGFLGLRPVEGARDPRLPSWRRNLGVYDMRRLRFLQLRNDLCLRYSEGRRKYWKKPGPGHALLRAAILGLDHFVLRHVWNAPPPRLSVELAGRLEEIYAPDEALLQTCLARLREAHGAGDGALAGARR